MESFADAVSLAGDAHLVLVSGAPRTGIAALAGQLAAHPDALLVDGSTTQALAWLAGRLQEPGRVDSPLLEMEAGLREIHGAIPTQLPSHLIVPVQGLMADQELQRRLLVSSLARRAHLLITHRSRGDTLASLARFPHLQPDLPDPSLDDVRFLTAADHLLAGALANVCHFQQHWSSAGFTWLAVNFEELTSNPDVLLSQLRDQLGMRPLEPEEQLNRRGGISLSLCCRQRLLDASSVGRWKRQLKIQSVGCEDASSSAAITPTEPVHPPLILTGRGGSGTRLLAEVFLAMGIHLGDSLNRSLDSLQWVDVVYEMALANLAGHTNPWRGTWAAELRHRARWHRSAPTPPDRPWGFKIPEAMLVAQELMQAWPGARLVHMVRHPLDVCLRRTHMTSRTTNPIGSATLRAAYQTLGRDMDPRIDPPHVRNAVSWWFQLSRMQGYKHRYGDRILEIRYEDLCDHTTLAAAKLARELHLQPASIQLQVDAERRRRWEPDDPRMTEIWELCSPLASLYGYTVDA